MFTVPGTLGCVGSPVGWAQMHHRHHRYSDREGDPYTAHRYRHPTPRALLMGGYGSERGSARALRRMFPADPLQVFVMRFGRRAMTGSAPPMVRFLTTRVVYGVAAVFLAGMIGSVEVSAEECGRLCDPRWMAKASVAEVRAELDAKPGAVNKRGRWEYTPLHFAAQANPDPRVLTLLLERGAELESRARLGATPLHVAAGIPAPMLIWALGPADGVEKAVRKYGLDRLLEEIRRIQLEHFSVGNTPEIVKFLLDSGANIAALNDGGLTPLHFAASITVYPRVIELLLQHGADPNETSNANSSPLHSAAMWNIDRAAAETLLQHGADLELRNKNGATPMHLATLWNIPVLELFLGSGGNVETRDNEDNTLLHWAASNPVVNMTKILVDHGADLKSQNGLGRTPLQRALAINSNPSIALLLIESGADIHVRDREERTTYELLKSSNHDACAWSCELYERLETALQ